MTCGIYKLNFSNTSKVYIGQSIDIENRFIKHRSAFNRNAAAPKLQEAYNIYGMPNLEIIIPCDMSELNTTEKEAIEIFDSVNSGFNTLYESGNPVLFGDKSGGSKYTNEQYISVLRLLVSSNPTFPKREIQEITGISLYTIRHIAALESHTWLKEVCPKEYSELQRIKTDLKYYRGNQYPKLISPTGIVHEVVHVTNFAKEHGLLQSKVTEVLKGTRNHHKGWTRVA